MNNIKFDFNDIREIISSASTAMQAEEIAYTMENNKMIALEMQRQSARRDATLVAGAEASIEQKELIEQQLEIAKKQNELLCDNYNKLKEMYDAQVQANKEAKEDVEKSRRFNSWMMAISVIAMLAAIASPVVTLLVS